MVESTDLVGPPVDLDGLEDGALLGLLVGFKVDGLGVGSLVTGLAVGLSDGVSVGTLLGLAVGSLLGLGVKAAVLRPLPSIAIAIIVASVGVIPLVVSARVPKL